MKVITLCMLLAVGLAIGAPSMRLGGRLTSYDFLASTSFEDTLGEFLRLTHEDSYLGVGLEAVYGPVWWLYGRLDLAEVRFYRYGGGALAVASDAGLDLLVEPQFRWRLLPYLWGGMTWTGWWGSQGTPDPRFSGLPQYKLRAGLGLGYRLSRSVNLFGEAQLVQAFATVVTSAPRDFSWCGLMVSGIGLGRANLGVRYDFGTK